MTPPKSGGASAMSEDVTTAVRTGQILCRQTTSAALQQRYELAIDELIRHPRAEGDSEVLLGKALAHARTHLRRRAVLAGQVPYSPELMADTAAAPASEHELMAEAVQAIVTSPLPAAQRGLLLLAAADVPVERIAIRLGTTPARVRERLARARAQARLCPSLACLRTARSA